MSAALSISTRAASLDRIKQQAFDLAVIGGGITGAGIALDAAARGFSVALVEKRDFASGTSSRSSKLIHGGLRYLEHFQIKLVREALHERAVLSRIAPHLSRPLAFLIPLYRPGKASPLGGSKLRLTVGLSIYDLLAGSQKIARHRWLSIREALKLAPMLDAEGLRGAFLYYDCLTDDARLVIEVIKAAVARGAAVANYARACGFHEQQGRTSGVEIEDGFSGRKILLRARVVVNAAGVWADEVSRLSDGSAKKRLRPSKGIHVVAPSEKFNNRVAVLIPSLGEQRFLFVIPWRDRTLIGTTDTDYRGDLDEPAAQAEEVSRVVESAARAFPASHFSSADCISTFAGLRPLVGGAGDSTAELSRQEEVFESESGLISVIGGKLTTYRRMAERVVDAVAARLARNEKSITERIELAGGRATGQDPGEEAGRATKEFQVRAATVDHLMETYGGNWRAVLEITREAEELKSALTAGLPHIGAEVVYGARHEMAARVEDFLARRTRIALLAPDHGASCAARVARLMGRELGWSSAEIEAETQNALASFAR